MRNVNIPTARRLQNQLRIIPAKASAVREALEKWKQGGTMTETMQAANLYLRGFGVKALFLDPSENGIADAVGDGQQLCYYVDRNNPNLPTLIYDNRLENFKVMKLYEFLDRQKLTG
ncbi:MAG: hypothetical protein JXQ27_14590 [Acidobacteria bacterium]|nr:hypothetical protein [Acidobacteriota bacterium]